MRQCQFVALSQLDWHYSLALTHPCGEGYPEIGIPVVVADFVRSLRMPFSSSQRELGSQAVHYLSMPLWHPCSGVAESLSLKLTARAVSHPSSPEILRRTRASRSIQRGCHRLQRHDPTECTPGKDGDFAEVLDPRIEHGEAGSFGRSEAVFLIEGDGRGAHGQRLDDVGRRIPFEDLKPVATCRASTILSCTPAKDVRPDLGRFPRGAACVLMSIRPTVSASAEAKAKSLDGIPRRDEIKSATVRAEQMPDQLAVKFHAPVTHGARPNCRRGAHRRRHRPPYTFEYRSPA